MVSGQSSFANSTDSAATASSKAKAIPRSRSKSSINLDACNSPDFNSVVLEKELTDLDIDDQVFCPQHKMQVCSMLEQELAFKAVILDHYRALSGMSH